MASQINAVENPIINSPYEEPKQHWHIEEGKAPEKHSGRRPASYFLRVPDRAARGHRSRDQSEMFEEDLKGNEYLLDLANLLRQRVQDWRNRNYQGATRVTRELLDLWRAPERERPDDALGSERGDERSEVLPEADREGIVRLQPMHAAVGTGDEAIKRDRHIETKAWASARRHGTRE